MTAQPERHLAAAPTPAAAAVRQEKAKAFGYRMRDFAELLGMHDDDRDEFAERMFSLADYVAAGDVSDGHFYAAARDATDMLPMTKSQALHFAVKVRKHLEEIMEEAPEGLLIGYSADGRMNHVMMPPELPGQISRTARCGRRAPQPPRGEVNCPECREILRNMKEGSPDAGH